MIRLFLARHGNTFEEGQTPIQVGARTDLPLTAFGRAQAASLAESFLIQGIVPKAIFAGKLKRQWETAQIVAERCKIPILESPLSEIDYGLWEGLTAEEISSRWPLEYADWNRKGKWATAIFNGSLENLLQTKEEWLRSLRNRFSPGDTIAAISSQGIFRTFHTQKVKTGHYCELILHPDSVAIRRWNVRDC